MLTKSSTLRLVLMLVIALLGAQWGAEAHAYSHIHHGASSGEPFDSAGRPCADCAAFAPLLAGATGATILPLLKAEGVAVPPRVAVVSLLFRLAPLAFRSRAPPSIRQAV